MKAISIIPGEPAKVIEIKNTLGALQGYVGGYIEVVGFPYLVNVLMIVNEVGKLHGMQYNFPLPNKDYIVGPCLVVGLKGENFTDLTDDQILAIENRMESVRELQCWEEL